MLPGLPEDSSKAIAGGARQLSGNAVGRQRSGSGMLEGNGGVWQRFTGSINTDCRTSIESQRGRSVDMPRKSGMPTQRTSAF